MNPVGYSEHPNMLLTAPSPAASVVGRPEMRSQSGRQSQYDLQQHTATAPLSMEPNSMWDARGTVQGNKQKVWALQLGELAYRFIAAMPTPATSTLTGTSTMVLERHWRVSSLGDWSCEPVWPVLLPHHHYADYADLLGTQTTNIGDATRTSPRNSLWT